MAFIESKGLDFFGGTPKFVAEGLVDGTVIRLEISVSDWLSTGSTQSACSMSFDRDKRLHKFIKNKRKQRGKKQRVPVVWRSDYIVVFGREHCRCKPVHIGIMVLSNKRNHQSKGNEHTKERNGINVKKET
jgi:hypothetical protein